MLSVQPGRLRSADEELRPIGVGSCVCHRQDSRSCVLERKILIRELLAIDALAAGSVSLCEVSALEHEGRNDAMEEAALVSEASLASAELTEVFSSLGDNISTELHRDAAGCLASDRDVEEDLWL